MTPTPDQAAREAAEKRVAESIAHYRKCGMTREEAYLHAAQLEQAKLELDFEWQEEFEALERRYEQKAAALAEREAECEREREKTKRACELWADTDTAIREILAKFGIKHDEDQPEATLHVADGVEQLAAKAERLKHELSGRIFDLNAAKDEAERLRGELASDGQRFANELRKVTDENAALKEQVEKMKAALVKIARWKGQFPETGESHTDGSPVSYGCAFGSNGERDYMRQVALDAIPHEATAARGERE